jgi:prepilin-type N-terminal cleavage/methylation domain-containing protein
MTMIFFRQCIRRFVPTGRAGFTLVELMISVAVISILAGMAAQVFTVLMESRDIAMRRIEISETANATLEFLATDLRSAFLTPDSQKPRLTNNDPEPRLRFVGISRDVVVEGKADLPVLGADEIEGNDYGVYPSDILHFITAVENSGDLILQEVSYGLNPEGSKLVRRSQILNTNRSTMSLADFKDFGKFIDNRTAQRLVPMAPVVQQSVNAAAVKQAIESWDTGATYGSLSSQTTNPNYVDRLFEVLAYEVRGLRIRYWYYDYNNGGWRVSSEWDSAQETALLMNSNLMNKLAANNSMEGNYRGQGFFSLIVNEPGDAYPRNILPNRFGVVFPIQNPQTIMTNRDYTSLKNAILEHSDGLPYLVEITIYVQDRDRTVAPKQFSTRVNIPNNYRNLGS